MPAPWKVSALALCVAAPLSGAAQVRPREAMWWKRIDEFPETPGTTPGTTPGFTDAATIQTSDTTVYSEVVSEVQSETPGVPDVLTTSSFSVPLPVVTPSSSTAAEVIETLDTAPVNGTPEETPGAGETSVAGTTTEVVSTTSVPAPVDTPGTSETLVETIETTSSVPAQQETPGSTDAETEVPPSSTETTIIPVETPGTTETTIIPVETPGNSETSTQVEDQTSTTQNPGQTSTIPSTTDNSGPTTTVEGAELVTGTDGAVATYAPEQNPDYTSYTGTTTITDDDNGGLVVIFPFGWFWKLIGGGGGGGGGGGSTPPAPTSNPDPNNNEDNQSNNDQTTADSTAESTAESTTETEQCTATSIPDCTRTISYYTEGGTEIMTEFGDCPTVVSCATGTQATATTTLFPDLLWVGGVTTDAGDDIIPEDGDIDETVLAALNEDLDALLEDSDTEATTTPGTETPSQPATTSISTEGSSTETPGQSSATETPQQDTTTQGESTSTQEETTTTSEAESLTPVATPSTFITTTRASSDTVTSGSTAVTTSDLITSAEPTRTYYPCHVFGGPRVTSAYCQCETYVNDVHYVATATLIDGQCAAYTEYPESINPTTVAPAITDAPINEPLTQTISGTVLVWSSYSLEYYAVYTIQVTQSVGLGEPSTVSTPVPTQTAVDNDGSGQCGTSDGLSKTGLGEACDRAINEFDDATIYTDYATRYSRSNKGILMVASLGQAACIAKFSCDDYGIGMSGKLIKEARESAKSNDNIWMCGHIYLSNSCKVVMDYCTNCKNEG